jgi:cell division control protein 45
MRLELSNWHLGYSQILHDCRGNNGQALILCNADVDAMASARILTYMLRNDNIPHRLLPCMSCSQLHEQLRACQNEFHAVVLLNLGASRDLTRLFQSASGNDDDTEDKRPALDAQQTKLYVMDCRRPVHLANIHEETNIVIFWDGVQNDMDIPSDGDHLSGNESSSSSSDEEDDDVDEGSLDEGEHEFDMEGDEGEAEFGEPDLLHQHEGAAPRLDDPQLDVGQEQETDYDGEDEHDDRPHDENAMKMNKRKAAQTQDDDEMSLTAEETPPTHQPTLTPRELHQQRRDRLRQYYASGSFYGSPASYVAYTIARSLRFKDNGNMLWLACVGVTDAYIHARLDFAGYSAMALELREICMGLFPNDDFSRVSNTVYSEQLRAPGRNGSSSLTRINFSSNGRILAEQDFRFFLLRHTSLYDAMAQSDYISTKFQLQTSKGKHKLQEMLAKMGFPLDECHQPFAFMKPSLRRQLQDKLREYADEYGLDNFEYTSFFRITGYQSLLSASDTSYAVTALLEWEPHDQPANAEDRLCRAFNEAYDALGCLKAPSVSLTGLSSEGSGLTGLVNGGKMTGGLGAGIRLAMSLQRNIMSTATSLIERNAVTRLSHFRYAYITCTSSGENGTIGGDENSTTANNPKDGDEETTHIFAKPLALTRLAHYLMDMNRENGKWTGTKARPLILMAEKPATKTFMVIGYEYPETSGAFVKNTFGKNFELAAQSMNGTFRFDSFDSNVVEVARSDVQRFIEQLHYLMDSL